MGWKHGKISVKKENKGTGRTEIVGENENGEK